MQVCSNTRHPCRRAMAGLSLLALAALSSAPGSNRALAAASLSDLTGPWHLFVDDHPVASKSNLSRSYHAFQKSPHNPLISADHPWEGTNVYVYGTVLPNESGPGYRMWYHCLSPTRALYATSSDGINWVKPNLGIVTYDGSTDNNILLPSGSFPSVMHTPWDAPIDSPYKMLRLGSGGYPGSYSIDGIHWVDSPNNPVVPPGGDVVNFVWDQHTQRYLGYPKVGAVVNGLTRRAVGWTTSANFESWPAPRLILAPDSIDDRWVPAGTVQRTHFYGLCGFAYESMYLGFLWIFRATDADGYYDGPIYVEIVSSPDGVHWVREEGNRPAILPLGAPGEWDDGMVFTTTQPLVEGNILRLYYGGFNDLHAQAKNWHGKIGMATLRKDGFASLDAGATIGTITTQKIDGASGPLRVNFSAGGAGWVRTEVLDEEGNVLPGYSAAESSTLTGDSVDQTVTWASQAELPSGAPIRLRFTLQAASVYSFAAGDGAVIIELPSVTQQPSSQTIAMGTNATLSIRARGTRPLGYQWKRNGLVVTDGGHFSGATTPTLTITGVGTTESGTYQCIVTNPYGTATSDPATISLLSASFTGLGGLPASAGSVVTGITADGTVVCGSSGGRAFVWTAGGAMQDLGLPEGATSASAAGVGTTNGGIVVAVNADAPTDKAKLWTGSTDGTGSYTSLPRAGTLEWQAKGLGTNGTNVWIAGSTFNGGDGNGRQAVLYNQATAALTLLGLPANGHDHSDSNAVADNGHLTGQYQYRGTAPTGGARTAMKSSNGTSTSALNTLLGAPSTSYEAIAKAISRNGLVQGGWSHYSGGGSRAQPVVWNNSVVPTAIPFIPGGDNDNHGEVLALSGDGSLAGGYSHQATTSGPKEAFIWDAANGTRQLQNLLATSYGVALPDWSLQEVRAISSDGTVLIGNGSHGGVSEGWVVTFTSYLPPPAPVITQDPETQTVCPGGSATFVVVATGTGPLGYAWEKDGSTLADDGHHFGTATATLLITDVSCDDAGGYRCIVSNNGGSVPSAAASLSLKPLVAADLDADCDVDQDDFILFQECASGANVEVPTGCTPADLDGDADVDMDDFGVFQRCYRGAGTAPDAACGN